ncbi:hypothetical protein B566_EDAN009138 [Ephemera danica]|nr:hypothetical protein B566_EDAN009138 [Ephemera danica]
MTIFHVLVEQQREKDADAASLLSAASEGAGIPEGDIAALPETEKLRNEAFGCEAHADSDDGVSIITDSDPEELGLPLHGSEFSPCCTHAVPRRQSQLSNDYFDQSDLSTQQELLEDLGENGDRKYVHRPNQKLNLMLNCLVIVCVAAVLGLGVGHFMGLQEECSLSPQSSNVLLDQIGFDTTSLLHKLEAENEVLKLQLKQLQEDMNVKNADPIGSQDTLPVTYILSGTKDSLVEPESNGMQWDILQVMVDPDHGTEATDIVGAVGQALADNLNKVSALEQGQDAQVLEKATEEWEHTSNPAAATQVEELQELQLENCQESNDIQLDYWKVQPPEAQHSMPQHSVQEETHLPDEVLQALQFEPKIASEPKEKIRRDETKGRKQPDNFFTTMEKELNGVMKKVLKFSSDFANKHDVQGQVSSSINSLSETLIEMQEKIKILGATTAEHSFHAMEKMKKKVYKMVQNVKENSENLMRNSKHGSLSSKVMKGLNNLKDGFMKRWSSLKDKMSQKLKGRGGSVTEPMEQPKGFSTQPKQQKKYDKKDMTVNSKMSKDDKPQHKQKSVQYMEEKNGYDAKVYKKNVKNGNQHQANHKYIDKRDRYEKTKYHQGKKSRDSYKKQSCWREGEHCNDTDGGWLDRLSESRASQRRVDQESEWLFDRARSRQEWRQGERDEDWVKYNVR